jgi:hypothetical protein
VENLRAVLTRPSFTASEIRLVRGVISALDRFTRNSPRGAGAPEGSERAKGPQEHSEEWCQLLVPLDQWFVAKLQRTRFRERNPQLQGCRPSKIV